MATRRVDCGDVFYPAPVVGAPVGSGAIWGDDSDATYADTTNADGAGGDVDWPAAYVVNPGGSLAITTLTIHLRAALLPGWEDDRVSIYAGTTVGLGDNDLTSLIDVADAFPVTLTETPTDYVIESTTPTTFINVLTGAWFVTVVSPFSVAGVARIYELWFEVGNPNRKAPPCQIFPRDDNLATGSAHIWPPPSSQQSGRPGGYY